MPHRKSSEDERRGMDDKVQRLSSNHSIERCLKPRFPLVILASFNLILNYVSDGRSGNFLLSSNRLRRIEILFNLVIDRRWKPRFGEFAPRFLEFNATNLVDPASCHMLLSRTKPCKCKSTCTSVQGGLCTAH